MGWEEGIGEDGMGGKGIGGRMRCIVQIGAFHIGTQDGC